MSWTERLLNREPFHENPHQNTRVFAYNGPSEFGSPLIVKEVRCANEAAARKAENEAHFGRDIDRNRYILECLGYATEPNHEGGFFVYMFSLPQPKSLVEEISERVKDGRFFLEEELRNLYSQMLEAFSYLQTLSIAHRDIKPDNILLDLQGQVKVCDFGLAKTINQTGPATVCASQFYASPVLREAMITGGKQWVDHNVFKSDVFSLGMTLLHLSLLYLPENAYMLNEKLRVCIDSGLNDLTRKYSDSWVNLLRLMLRMDENQRPDFLTLKNPDQYADDDYLPQIQAGEEVSEPLKLSVKCGLSQVRVSANQVDEVPCMISLEGRAEDPKVRTYSMDLMCVIDLSKSMGGSRINLVRTSLKALLDMLGDRDRVSIVGFNAKAERQCHFIRCTMEGKECLRTIIENLTCKGRTNLAPGFLMGLEVLKQRRSLNTAVSLFLFSDGENNQGEDPAAMCKYAMQEHKLEKFSVVTFGYGSQVNTELLVALASLGKGLFHHITQPDDIQKAFELAFWEVNSVVARKLHVSLALMEGAVPCEITKIFAKDAGNAFDLPNLCANARKELIFLLKPRHMELLSKTSYPVVHVTLNYEDNDETICTKTATLDARFVKWGSPPVPEDTVVYRHWFRVRGAEFLREAQELGNAGRFIEADQVLCRGIDALSGGSCYQVPLVQSVLRDMIQARDLVRNKETWKQGGNSHFAAVSYSHFSQSATTLTMQYATRQQEAPQSPISERVEQIV